MKKPLKTALAGLSVALLATAAVALEPTAGPWIESVDEAVEKARAEDRQILVDLWADWCTWCKRLEDEVFSTDEFQDYAQRYVLLRVDTEDGDEGSRLKERYRVEGLPTTLILSKDLVKVGALQGFLKTDQYIQNLELERAMYVLLEKAYQEMDEAGPETMKMVADDLHSRQDGGRAAPLYRELVEMDDVDPGEAAWNRYLLADSLRLGGEMKDAARAVEASRAAAIEIDDTNLVELSDLLPYQIARDQLQCNEARRALRTFLRRHPEGTYREQADAALAAMKRDRRCA